MSYQIEVQLQISYPPIICILTRVTGRPKKMNLYKFVKLFFFFSVIISTISCSSTGEEVSSEVSDVGESGIEATTRRAQELESERQAWAAAAAERMRRSALATRVFYFDFDTAEFRSADRGVLDYHAQDLASNSDKRIRIEGHADERGTREYNLALGERRANAVKDFLTSLGVDIGRISTISYGKERPSASGNTSEAWSENRRAVTIVGN